MSAVQEAQQPSVPTSPVSMDTSSYPQVSTIAEDTPQPQVTGAATSWAESALISTSLTRTAEQATPTTQDVVVSSLAPQQLAAASSGGVGVAQPSVGKAPSSSEKMEQAAVVVAPPTQGVSGSSQLLISSSEEAAVKSQEVEAGLARDSQEEEGLSSAMSAQVSPSSNMEVASGRPGVGVEGSDQQVSATPTGVDSSEIRAVEPRPTSEEVGGGREGEGEEQMEEEEGAREVDEGQEEAIMEVADTTQMEGKYI